MSDWLYTEERLRLRSKCLGTLLHLFGWKLNDKNLPMYSMELIHNCAHDWVSQGNSTDHGIGNYFLKNYAKG